MHDFDSRKRVCVCVCESALRLVYVLRLHMQTGHGGHGHGGAPGGQSKPNQPNPGLTRGTWNKEQGQELCVQLYLLIYTIINTNVHKSSLYFVLCSGRAAEC